jgi:O-antigen/teichoic acid export membrane protein
MLAVAAMQVDVLLGSRWLDQETIGRYALALTLASKADVLNQSLFAALLPSAAALTTRADLLSFVRRTFARNALSLLAFLPLLAFAGPLIVFFYGQSFASSAGLFRALLLVTVLDLFVAPVMMIAYAAQRPRGLAADDGARAGFLVAGDLALVPVFGVGGAVAARALSRVAGFAVAVWYAARILRGSEDQSEISAADQKDDESSSPRSI